jgi:hypothetical protein
MVSFCNRADALLEVMIACTHYGKKGQSFVVRNVIGGALAAMRSGIKILIFTNFPNLFTGSTSAIFYCL